MHGVEAGYRSLILVSIAMHFFQSSSPIIAFGHADGAVR
jgi:hypothetical protein